MKTAYTLVLAAIALVQIGCGGGGDKADPTKALGTTAGAGIEGRYKLGNYACTSGEIVDQVKQNIAAQKKLDTFIVISTSKVITEKKYNDHCSSSGVADLTDLKTTSFSIEDKEGLKCSATCAPIDDCKNEAANEKATYGYKKTDGGLDLIIETQDRVCNDPAAKFYIPLARVK